MKSVLIVSDNVELVSFFQQQTNLIPIDVASFDYCYSVVNKAPEKLIALGMRVLDLKSEKEIANITLKYNLIISAHCKQIFPKELVKNVRCINIHPGLNPHNRGWFPQVFSIINKKPVGCTIHVMDEEIDHGDIIYQQEVKINSWDTSLDVYNNVVQAEKKLISNHLLDLIDGKYRCIKVKDKGNYNGIKDFNALGELQMSSTASLKEHIDILRALTHGDFNNAYFIDEEGNKIFIKLQLEKVY